MPSDCLLIVEDDAVLARNIELRLMQLGYDVAPVAATGGEAISTAGTHHPDLVLMDIHLAGSMDGIEAAGIIKERYGIPVMYVTAYIDDAMVQRAKATEPVGYLVKPFEMNELATTIELQLYRRRMERSLRASEERYKRITESVSDYIYTVRTQDGVVVSTEHGEACAGVTGFSTSEFKNDPYLWWRMVHEEDRDNVVSHAERILRDQDDAIIEHRIVRKDGSVRWVRNTPVLSFDARGNMCGYDGVIRDITERKTAQMELQRSEARFRAIHRWAGIGIAMVDMSLHIVEANPALQKMLGYSLEELHQTRLEDITDAPAMQEERRQLSQSLTENHDASYSLQKKFKRKGGSFIWTQVTITFLYDEAGKPQYGLWIIEDMTERKRAEQEREELIVSLQKALAEVKTLGGLIPICSSCKRIRDDKGYWNLLEKYLSEHSDATVSHGICPECERQLYPQLYDEHGQRKGRRRQGAGL